MEREEAEQMMAGLAEVHVHLSAVMESAERIDDVEVKKSVKRALAQVVGAVWFDVMAPICRQFPDLDPDIGSMDDGAEGGALDS